MLRRKAIIAIILISMVLAGCSPVSGTTGQAQPSKTQEGQKADVKVNEEKQVDEKVLNKNIGVINDTVVDVFRNPDVQSERVTQAIYNQQVEVMESQEAWVKVKVVDGYTGWIKSKNIYMDTWSLNYEHYKYKIIVTSKTKKIFSQIKTGGTIKEIVMGTELYALDKTDNWYRVALPGKTTGWVADTGSIELPVDGKIPKTSAADFIATAAKLKGSVYLWGGVSSWGIDCSGLTYICARINGVTLPRDADQQYLVGLKIEKNTGLLKQGDLLFFSTKEDLKDISHVGIYMENSQFIHASKSKGSVTIGSINDDYFKKRLVGIRRYFDN